MTMIKTGLLNFLSVIIKVITGLILNKIMALYIGPAGYALASQFQNGINFVTTFATGAITTGVTKYTAEYANDDKKLSDLFKSTVLISSLSCLILSIMLFTLSDYISEQLLKSRTYSSVIRWFSITIFLFVANLILISIVNGFKHFKKYVVINISGSITSLFFSGTLIYFLNLKGAFIAFATNQSIVFFMTFFLVSRQSWMKLKYFIGFPKEYFFIKKLAQYSLMAIVSAFCVIYMQIAIRDYIAAKFSWEQAGIWDGVWRISSLYLMVVTVPLGVYYLPRLSELKTSKLIAKEIKLGYAYILPLVIVASLCIFLLRDFIIQLLFSKSFLPMNEIIGWQLIGDVFKIGSWLLSYLMLSKALTKTYIITEIVTALLFLGLVHYLTASNGLIGVTQAYCLTYLVYWIMMIIIMSIYFKSVSKNE